MATWRRWRDRDARRPARPPGARRRPPPRVGLAPCGRTVKLCGRPAKHRPRDDARLITSMSAPALSYRRMAARAAAWRKFGMSGAELVDAGGYAKALASAMKPPPPRSSSRLAWA